MRPIKTKNTNAVLKAPPDSANVIDLPITRIRYEDGTQAVESCWELTEEEIKKITETKRIYFICVSVTHPPILLSVESEVE